MSIEERLGRIENVLASFQGMLEALVERETARRWYTTGQFAKTVGLAEFTVREYCRLGRLNARKRRSGRGPHAAWAISHHELRRYQEHGLLPVVPTEVAALS
ncbi:MAG TPA: hypothetical protein VG826_05545 [Pirellulales bacterium]|nr:hypothetical protein [Pirellulales bacterium]